MRAPRRFRVRRDDAERGTVLVLTALLLTSLLGMTAIVVDLGAQRGRVRVDQSIADFAALSAGRALGGHDPVAGCTSAVKYINTNARLSTPINASTFCAGMNNTFCSGGPAAQAKPSTTVGEYTISVHYPVPDSEIADPDVAGGVRIDDGNVCERIRVVVESSESSLFGRIVGVSELSGVRTATARPWPVGTQLTPALWLLDPKGCVSLNVGGGSQVTVGTDTVPGILTIDSDGTLCSANQQTLTVDGSGTTLRAVPLTGGNRGVIQLFALPPDAIVCSGTACRPTDVSSGKVQPQPVPVSSRATRSRVDDIYNCRNPYPASAANYHGITLVASCDPLESPPYIQNLKTAIGASGMPSSVPTGSGAYQRWTTAGLPCNVSGTISVSGNWWVDCGGQGLQISNGNHVEFRDGNVVFDSGFKMTGGSIKFNTNNTKALLPSGCRPPNVIVPCTGIASPLAAMVYVRNGDINITGGELNVNHAFVYMGTGAVSVSGAPPRWVAPFEGPFSYLALWSDMPSTSNNLGGFQLTGGTGVQLTGVFFTPEAAPFKLAGGGTWGQVNAQFISRQLTVTGGGILTMAPDPARSVKTPQLAGTLIR